MSFLVLDLEAVDALALFYSTILPDPMVQRRYGSIFVENKRIEPWPPFIALLPGQDYLSSYSMRTLDLKAMTAAQRSQIRPSSSK
jgi:hypothetical protein